MVKGETMKFYSECLRCPNCFYTRANSDWYTSKETKVLYCSKDCYLAKEKGINSWWNEDRTLNEDNFLKTRTLTAEGKI
jgi:hypothetical protein